MQLNGLKVNFLGDSITSGWGASSEDKVFPQLLKENAKLSLARNYGVGGTRISSRKNEWDKGPSFSERFSEMSDDADLIVVFGGTNDFGHGTDIGCFDDKTPDLFYGACHYLFSGLIKKYIGKPIVIMTPLHRVNENQIINKRKDKLKEYVKIIREIAEYYSLPVLDLYSTSGIQPEIPEIKEKYMPDGLHPNDAGHAVIAYKLQRFLEQL